MGITESSGGTKLINPREVLKALVGATDAVLRNQRTDTGFLDQLDDETIKKVLDAYQKSMEAILGGMKRIG